MTRIVQHAIAIEDYGDEQQETDPKIDDELVAKESSISKWLVCNSEDYCTFHGK